MTDNIAVLEGYTREMRVGERFLLVKPNEQFRAWDTDAQEFITGELKMKHTIEKQSGPFGRERLTIRTFRDSSAMHRFLNTGTNALTWRESRRGLASGTYAYAGGQWHNVRKLDASVLAHIASQGN